MTALRQWSGWVRVEDWGRILLQDPLPAASTTYHWFLTESRMFDGVAECGFRVGQINPVALYPADGISESMAGSVCIACYRRRSPF